MMNGSEFVLPGLLAPEQDTDFCPYPGGREWFQRRNALGRALAAYSAESSSIRHFPPTAEEALAQIAIKATNLAEAWAPVFSAMFDEHWADAPPKTDTTAAYELRWRWVGPAFLVLNSSGNRVIVTTGSAGGMSATQIIFETIAIAYTRTAIHAHLAAVYAVRGAHLAARRHSALAASLAKQCADVSIDLNRISPPAEQRRLASPLLAPHFWRRWLASVLLAHAHYCVSLSGARVVENAVTAFSSGRLLTSIVAVEAPPFVADHAMREHIDAVGAERQRDVLATIGAILAQRAMHPQIDIVELIVATRLIYWFTSGSARPNEFLSQAFKILVKSLNKSIVTILGSSPSITCVEYGDEADMTTTKLTVPRDLVDYVPS